MDQQQFDRYKKQAERMVSEAERGVAILFHAKDKRDNISEKDGRLVETPCEISAEETIDLIGMTCRHVEIKLENQYERRVFERCVPFIENKTSGDQKIPEEIEIKLFIFRNYFDNESGRASAPNEDEILNFIEISYFAERTIALAFLCANSLEGKRQVFVRSQNKHLKVAKENKDLLIALLKNNKEAVFSNQRGGRKVSLNQVCENIRDQIKAQRPREAAPTTTTVKNWLKTYFDITPRNVDQFRTIVENL